MAVGLVPVPSRPAARTGRGYDHARRLSDQAAALRQSGTGCEVLGALRHRRVVADQAELDTAARAANLAGALATRPRPLARLAGRSALLVDDVITTGATLAEAARALRAAGIEPVAAAVVAATVRRSAQTGTGGNPGHPTLPSHWLPQ